MEETSEFWARNSNMDSPAMIAQQLISSIYGQSITLYYTLYMYDK